MRRAIVGIVVTVLSLLALPFAAPQAGAAAADPVIIVAGTFSPSLANEPLAARARARRVPGVDLPSSRRSAPVTSPPAPGRSTPSPTRSAPRPAPPRSTSSVTRRGASSPGST